MSKWDIDLTGKYINDWLVMQRSDKKYYWTCVCKCGKVKDVWYSGLLNGNSKGCGCESWRNYDEYYKEEVGKQYGRLKVLKFIKKENNSYYFECECSCKDKNKVIVGLRELRSGSTSSCGCIRKERGKTEKEKLEHYRKIHHELNYKDGTSLTSLAQKVSKNNKTGYKGVSKLKDGRCRAYIFIKGKQKHLGIFNTAEEAHEAYLRGVDKYFKPILEKYKEDS